MNIRATLAEAVRAELLSNSEAAALIAAAKRVCYAERSWPALLHGLPEVRHAALRKFIETQSINLKERDALSALHCAAALRDAPPVALEPVGRVRPSLYHAEAALRRGFLHPTGCLVSGRRVLFEALKSSEQIDALRPELMRRHFLLQWARDHEVSCPDEHLDEFRARRGMPDHSLPALGLTPQERDMALAEEALLAWLLARGPEHFGLRFDRHRRYVEALLPLLAPDAPQERRAEFLTRAAETCFLADWARQNDFKLPAEDFAAFLGAWESSRNISPRDAWLKSVALSENDYLAISEERALYHLLGMRGPAWFGYESWSFERAFLNHLQYTGAAADFVAKMHLPVAA